MQPEMFEKINKAIETILSGVCKRVDINHDVKVYAVKDVIRIDIKVPGNE